MRGSCSACSGWFRPRLAGAGLIAAALCAVSLSAPAAGAAPTPATTTPVGQVAATGPVAPTGQAAPTPQVAPPNSALGFGSAAILGGGDAGLATPVTAIAATADGGGYWLATATGQVAAFGDASDQGSPTGSALTSLVVAMAADRANSGYWLATADGDVLAVGAPTFGSAAAMALNSPIVGMAATPDGGGYWLVAGDGGIFSFGDARFFGSTGAMTLDSPIVGMAATADGGGYWLAAGDGGVFTFGDAPFVGSGAGAGDPPTVGIAGTTDGYWLAESNIASGAGETPARLQQLLASLGYLPVSWAPDGMKPGTALDAQLAALEQPAAGTFAWRWAGSPPSLVALWQPGVSTAMETGALMAFESQQGLAVDGVAGPAVWSALLGAATDPGPLMNQHGYTYALASETVPESLTVWHNGAVVDQAPANTGISAAPTPLGTWPVYERLQSQIMRGTNPDGSTYADPVQWVAYFNGSDAIHYIARGSYGYPQSVGCVEVSYTTGETVWPYLTYGSLVTVAP
jgi:peptidoglycan hydrolase-like protein with peptidoglycan-binding domain